MRVIEKAIEKELNMKTSEPFKDQWTENLGIFQELKCLTLEFSV